MYFDPVQTARIVSNITVLLSRSGFFHCLPPFFVLGGGGGGGWEVVKYQKLNSVRSKLEPVIHLYEC